MLPVTVPRSIGKFPGLISAASAVDAFVDRLAELPCSSWIAVGRSLVENASGSAPRTTPRAILEATIADADLSVAAWYVRDAIETSAYYASPPLRRWTSTERRCFAAAHAAAEEAALAILMQVILCAEDFEALCAPFAKLVGDSARMGA